MECEVALINSNTQEIKEYFKNTKTVAILGLSPNPQKDSHRVALYLQQAGYKIFPVYPKEDTILNEKVHKNLSDIEENIDMVIVFRKPNALNDIVNMIINRDDIKILWTQIGIVNNEATQIAKNNNIKIVQNRCAMIEHKRISI